MISDIRIGIDNGGVILFFFLENFTTLGLKIVIVSLLVFEKFTNREPESETSLTKNLRAGSYAWKVSVAGKHDLQIGSR